MLRKVVLAAYVRLADKLLICNDKKMAAILLLCQERINKINKERKVTGLNKIRVTIADDHPLVINGLKQILECCEDIEIISTYANGQELLEGLVGEQPDVLLLDIQMPYKTGDEVAPLILDAY